MATDIMISTKSLTKRFGAVRALDKVSFQVRKGEVVGFLGPNGAGKSTTMRILTCFISPTTGGAQIHGHDVFDEPLAVRQKIGYLPQRAPLYTDMNAYEYLQFTAQVRGLDESTFKRRLKKVVEVCGLAQSLGKDISTLSHGFRQRVGLAQALIHDPPILILDEPTSDLDPNEKAEVLKYIKEIGKDHTILLSTHNLAEVEEACARAIIISKGRVVADGPLDEIRAKQGRVRYLVTIDEQDAEKRNGSSGKPPTATEVQDAFQALSGAKGVRELPTDETAHKFEVGGDREGDLRAEIFRLVVGKGWTLLELRRDERSLDAVFRDLTRGDERLDRGLAPEDDEGDDDDFDDEADDDEDDDDESDDDEKLDDEDEPGDEKPEDDDEPDDDDDDESEDDDDDDDDDDDEKDEKD